MNEEINLPPNFDLLEDVLYRLHHENPLSFREIELFPVPNFLPPFGKSYLRKDVEDLKEILEWGSKNKHLDFKRLGHLTLLDRYSNDDLVYYMEGYLEYIKVSLTEDDLTSLEPPVYSRVVKLLKLARNPQSSSAIHEFEPVSGVPLVKIKSICAYEEVLNYLHGFEDVFDVLILDTLSKSDSKNWKESNLNLVRELRELEAFHSKSHVIANFYKVFAWSKLLIRWKLNRNWIIKRSYPIPIIVTARDVDEYNDLDYLRKLSKMGCHILFSEQYIDFLNTIHSVLDGSFKDDS